MHLRLTNKSYTQYLLSIRHVGATLCVFWILVIKRCMHSALFTIIAIFFPVFTCATPSNTIYQLHLDRMLKEIWMRLRSNRSCHTQFACESQTQPWIIHGSLEAVSWLLRLFVKTAKPNKGTHPIKISCWWSYLSVPRTLFLASVTHAWLLSLRSCAYKHSTTFDLLRRIQKSLWKNFSHGIIVWNMLPNSAYMLPLHSRNITCKSIEKKLEKTGSELFNIFRNKNQKKQTR